jgi:two-component system, OmpR family, sensor histidine kinase KdpD
MAAEVTRPRPEQFLDLIRRQERGRLKVYLGSAAGVGKTYAMLREGHRLKRQGVDAAIGFVETHGRVETAEQVGDLPVIPPREIEYRGVTLREMDLDAILARRPTVCLVDELAHTNAPGSRHPKRYQDVEELLRAGIHVITTVNIQHLESLYDEVERATGVKVKERLPDSVLAEADQIVNVDVSAEDLLERLKAGKVYPPERAERALENFFTPANLTRLREIALREIAHLIDRRGRRAEADRAPALAAERVMVGLSSRSPNAPALLRKAARLADRLNAPWYAVYIKTPAEDRRGHAPHPGQEPGAGAAAGGHPDDLPGPRRGEHDPRLRAGVRNQGDRHGQGPPALAPPALGRVGPGAPLAGDGGDRRDDRGRLSSGFADIPYGL